MRAHIGNKFAILMCSYYAVINILRWHLFVIDLKHVQQQQQMWASSSSLRSPLFSFSIPTVQFWRQRTHMIVHIRHRCLLTYERWVWKIQLWAQKEYWLCDDEILGVVDVIRNKSHFEKWTSPNHHIIRWSTHTSFFRRLITKNVIRLYFVSIFFLHC